jgi:hypothetical protein
MACDNWLKISAAFSALSKDTFFMLCAAIMPPDPLADFIIRESLLQTFENVRSL